MAKSRDQASAPSVNIVVVKNDVERSLLREYYRIVVVLPKPGLAGPFK